MADSDFFPVPLAGLLDKEYLKGRSRLISMDKSMGVPVAGVPAGVKQALAADQSANLPGTTHLSIIDAAGNVVSMTTTVESAFGSKQMVHGFLLNNQLTDFSFVPMANGAPVANRVEPRKRPRSAMAPTIVLDREGQVKYVIGSPGGSSIIQFVTKTLIGVLDWKLSIQDSINLGNFGAQTRVTTFLERNSGNQKLKAGLEAKGHTVSLIDINSGLHGIAAAGGAANSGWTSGIDPRREGAALGD
jgi:gamma-glutamyltranspeptidase/glutathione hydrolase